MTSIEQIAEWIQDKPLWWKHAVSLALENGELEHEELSKVYRVARMVHLLDHPSIEFINASIPIDFTGYATEQHEVILSELSNV